MKQFIALLTFACIIQSCSKEKELDKPNAGPSINYTPMSVGNYWVYGHFDIDTLGQEIQLNATDSVFISKVVTIRGNAYFVFEGTNYPYSPSNEISVLKLLRDSSGYLVDTSGRVLFSSHDFSDSLEANYEIINFGDTFHSDVFQMKISNLPIQVPADAFNDVLIYHGLHYMHMTKLPVYVPNPRNYDFYYANGIGLIKNTYFYSLQAGYSESRLLRYHIQ